jgi:hypothetical protein
MMKSRSTKEYRDGCRSFVDFAIQNCRTLDRLIVCLCKMRRLLQATPARYCTRPLDRGERNVASIQRLRFITVRGLYELLLKALI